MKPLLFLFLLLLAGQASAEAFFASVDRTRLSEGETVVLTLESTDPTRFGRPDLSPLEQDFEILGSRQVNRLSSIGDTPRASTRWILTLQPRRSGEVTIPAIRLEDAETLPITLNVEAAVSAGNGEQLAPVFIDASLDQESVYVQAQAVLTLRIYHSVSMYDDSSLTPLRIADARVEQLGEPRTYEKRIGGVLHGVIELQYAIYPQRSGELMIPGQTFSATLVDRSRSNDFMPFGPRTGKVSRVKSPDIPLQVKPKPADYPADAPWLPARALGLAETWNPQPEQSQVGDSLTRRLILKVDGLSSAQLPPLPATQVDGLRRYPDQPQMDDQKSENGIVGTREEREALVPSRAGNFELPPLEIVWWNTQTDTLERTTLSARTLQVAENPQLQNDEQPNTPMVMTQVIEGPKLWPWQLACAVLSLTTLLGFGLWWHARRQPAIQRAAQSGPSPRTLLDDIKRACQAGDAQATRHALDAWARQQPETLADMAARYVPLSDALDGLNGALYSEVGQQWQGEELWKAIRNLPTAQEPSAAQQESSALPPLYPR
ncbi:BatD family protein [Ectopseudomonas oleovorans]|uniref:BatD family protein n=1 Tax=Ectopseudomonas oleovorans TaxID=301 RepID=UPI0019D0C9E8|nr:BatD family protein [Pseudomonas oleovorans]MBN7118339.1 protein BatD [Pseudomonas oleovorans]MBN7134620.1 protein BatD [Pseudomonas oleovorans]MBN7142164.1 protein BatD [Pseudomonas oleovorans]